MDWETYNIDQNDRKLVDVVVAYGHAFPVKDADGNEVLSGAIGISGGDIQTAWERNKTPGSEGTSDSLQSMTVSTIDMATQNTNINFNDFYDIASGKFLWLRCQ